MMRNDYRRSLILLRSNAAGYSGHVRLERRTLMGTMYFLMQTGGGCPGLRVALVGKGRSGACYACAVGETCRDARGQSTLSYSFNPRDICARELEQYQLIAVTRADDDACEVVLFGNVCGHADLDWDEVRAALRKLYCGDTPVPLPDDVPVTELPAQAVAEPEPRAVAPEEEEMADKEVDVQAEIPEADMPVEAADEALPGADPAPAAEAQIECAEPAPSPATWERLEALGVSVSQPWPEGAEPLRELFRGQAALEDAPDGDCVYVAAPMPEGCGYPYAAAGLRAEGGRLIAVRYALPAVWAQYPPAGLEDYIWVGNRNRGWWRIELPLDD